MKKLPIGVDNFEEMITDDYYYVDKSLFVKDVKTLSGKVKLITRPRRFGKTLNMDMIKEFYSIDGKDLFNDLKIMREKAFVKDNYHRYPVLLLSFNAVKSPDWDGARQSLVVLFGEMIRQFLRKNSDEIDEEDRKLLKNLLNDGSLPKYVFILRILTRILYERFRKKVILLIDEYDVPIEAAYTYRHRDLDYYENMVAFMRDLLTAALKDNPYLEFAILTGVYRVAKESIFSGLNNVATYTIFENEMADKFGFIEDEVFDMFKYYGLEEDIGVVGEWYNGYVFGNAKSVYNPWSVIYYIKERLSGKSIEQALQPFWINTSSNDLIIRQIETNSFFQDKLDKLLSREDLVVSIDPFLSLREIDQYPSGVWTLLAHAGYINAVWVAPKEYRVFIPNKEIEEFYKERVMLWIEGKAKVSFYEMYSALKETIRKGNVGKFSKLLEEYLENSLSYFDIGYDDSERVYKAFVLGMLSMAINGYVVETETESGYGRVDVAVYPKDKEYGEYALVMELKKADSDEKLDETAKEAIEQIKEKGYSVKYEKLGYKVLPIGIAFHGKRVLVRVDASWDST